MNYLNVITAVELGHVFDERCWTQVDF